MGGGVIADLSFNLIKSSRGSVGEKTELMILHLLLLQKGKMLTALHPGDYTLTSSKSAPAN